MCLFEGRKREYRSDVMHFTIPEKEDKLNDKEVLYVQQEFVPQRLRSMFCKEVDSLDRILF